MNQKLKLGQSQVRRIGLGTNRLTKTRDNVTFVKAAVAAGIQMIDTAHLYTAGQSEEAIGAALSPIPADCVVATKGGFEGGHGRPQILRSEIEESLRRLRTDSIDLYYLHRVHPDTPLEDSLAVIKEYLDGGRIRQVGLSEVDNEQIERARRVVPISAVQNRYNISERKWDPVVDYCANEGIVFVPFFPLRGELTPAVREIANRHRATPHQIMLAWLLRRSPLMLPIPGTRSLDHLKQNLASLQVELSEADFQALSKMR